MIDVITIVLFVATMLFMIKGTSRGLKNNEPFIVLGWVIALPLWGHTLPQIDWQKLGFYLHIF